MNVQDVSGNRPPVIFVVDDEEGARQLLVCLLAKEGYATRAIHSGRLAVQAAIDEPPDLVLLDVILPDLDGFEVCRILKENPATRYVPVVMVTCLGEKELRMKGMEAGADDFITKPFDAAEILLRTRNLLLVKEHQDFLKDHAAILEQMVQQRTEELEQVIVELKTAQQQLVQREKMAAIGQLTAGIAHEINNPIGFIASNVGSLGKYCERLSKFIVAQQEVLASGEPDSRQAEQLQSFRDQIKVDRIIRDVPAIILETLDGVDRIKSIVRDLKCFSRADESDQKLADINQCLESTLNIVKNELKYKATIRREYGELPQLRCYPQQLNQVFLNLLVNAAHAIDTHGEITVRSWRAEGKICVSVSDTGCGIPEQHQKRIFEPFFTTKGAGVGTGLGLSISQEIVRNHGGEIGVASEPGKGSTFTISIPIDDPA